MRESPDPRIALSHFVRYLDDLRQVASGYYNLPKNLKIRMRNAEIFLGLRKKRDPGSAEAIEYSLRRIDQVLIADDMDSHRLFGSYIFVAPKDEVFESELTCLLCLIGSILR